MGRSRLAAVLMVALLAGCASSPLHSLVDRDAEIALPSRDLPNFGRVSPTLYRGAQPTAEGFRRLEKMGVKTIIDLRAFHNDEALVAGTHLRVVRIACNPLAMREKDVIAFLKVVNDPAIAPVFVHCEFGADRTGMMVAAYRMAMQGWSNEQAAEELPAYGFHEALGGIRAYVARTDGEHLRQAAGVPEAVAGEQVQKL